MATWKQLWHNVFRLQLAVPRACNDVTVPPLSHQCDQWLASLQSTWGSIVNLGFGPTLATWEWGDSWGPEPTGQPLPLFRFRVRVNVLSRRHCQSQPSQLFCLAGHREWPAETSNWLQTSFCPKCLWWTNVFYNLKNSIINEREGESWVWANTGIKKAHSSGNINGSFVYK